MRASTRIAQALTRAARWRRSSGTRGELYPCVGFIVTNMTTPAERVVAFYNQRGTAEQWIKEGKKPSCEPRRKT
jgi:hypothetical protein